MNVDINQLDLNELFRFDLLKNILVNISTEQKKLIEEVRLLKMSNKNRDEKIKNLEKINTLRSFGLGEELNKNDNQSSFDKQNKETKINKISFQSEEVTIEKINDKEKDKTINEDNKNKYPTTGDKNNNSSEQDSNNITNYFENKKNIKKTFLYKGNKNNMSKSKETILLFMREIHSLEDKISNLENKLKHQFESQIKKIEEKSEKNMFSDFDENKYAYERLEKQLNILLQNKEEQNRKIENCLLKCDSIDIYNLLKDNGDGTIDATKLMVSTLEDKIMKKLEFIDERHKKASEDIVKLLKSDEINFIKIEKIQKNLIDIKYNDIAQVKDNFKNNFSEYDQKISEIINTVNEQEIDLSQKINDLENNIMGIFDEKEEIILNKNNENIIEIQNKLSKLENELGNLDNNQPNFIQDLQNDINRKISVLKNQTNNIETTLKTINDSFDPRDLRDDIDTIKNILAEKITKNHLKELYNLNLNNVEDISNTRKTIATLQEEIRKVTTDIDMITPKVNSFMAYLITKKNKKKESKKKEIDFEQFVKKNNFEEGMKYFTRKIESIFIELESLKRNLDDLKLEQNSFEKKDIIMKLEENFHVLLDENKNKLQKNRNELNKQIKNIEIEIKSLWAEFKKRESADSWILAKQPIKCFNCATCDSDIKIDSQREEYVPWNKILPNQRSYRMGKGFSHMLEKMSNELINNMEENNESKEIIMMNLDKNSKNSSTNNAVNKSTQIEEHKLNPNEKNNHIINNIAQIERSSSQSQLNFKKGRNARIINSVKVKLPQVVDMARKKAIFETFKNINSLSDRDKYTVNEYSQRNLSRIDSPRILKIIKKNNTSNTHNISFVQSSKDGKI